MALHVNKKVEARIFTNIIKGIFATISYKDLTIKPILSLTDCETDTATVVKAEAVMVKIDPEDVRFSYKTNLQKEYNLKNEYCAYKVVLKSGETYNCLKIYGTQSKHIYPEHLQQVIHDYQAINRYAKYRNWFLVVLLISPFLEWWQNKTYLLDLIVEAIKYIK